MYGQRVLAATGKGAEGDRLLCEFVYNDTSGSLAAGQPLGVDQLDAADNNAGDYILAAALTPATARTGGNVLLATNAQYAGGNFMLAAIFQPDAAGTKPNKGDVIKCMFYGRGIIFAEAATAGTAVKVGDFLQAVKTTTAFCRSAAAAINTNGGLALATGAVVTTGATIIAVPGGGVTDLQVNAFIFIK